MIGKPKCHATLDREGKYLVTLDGRELGYVQKKQDHYNLRRAVTVTSWLVMKADGEALRAPWSHSGGWLKRADAVNALVEATRA